MSRCRRTHAHRPADGSRSQQLLAARTDESTESAGGVETLRFGFGNQKLLYYSVSEYARCSMGFLEKVPSLLRTANNSGMRALCEEKVR